MSDDPREVLATTLRRQGFGCDQLGSPLYAALCERMAADVEAEGPTWRLLEPFATEPLGAAYPLRVLGGAHRLALVGDAPALERHLPSTGGDGDVDGAWAALHELIRDPPYAITDALTRPPQTNEIGRSASLIGGFLLLAHETRLPLNVLEIGSSAGLNLRFDRFRYEQGADGYGPRDSAVRFADLWPDATPPFDAPLTVVDRQGCDVDPVDVASADGRVTLLSYIWPDQSERFTRTAAAIDIASEVPATVDDADAVDWIPARLAERPANAATVVFHSIMWQYLSELTQERITEVITQSGEAATRDAPLVWLWLEPEGDMAYPRLRLRVWPEGSNRLLARCSFHLGPVTWLV